MLDVVREYALEQLAASGESDTIFSRHAAYFAVLAERAERASSGPKEAAGVRRCLDDLGNLRAALAWSTRSGDNPDAERRLAAALKGAASHQQMPEEAIAAAVSISSADSDTSEAGATREPVVALGVTPREVDVLRLLGHGRSNRDIGERLFISPSTVNVHVSNLLAKLELESRAGAAAFAVRHGLA